MPTVTSPLNLTKPTVGGDGDVWGQYWNDNADKLNAIHIDDGTGTSVGMHVGTGKVLKVDGGTSDVVLPGQLDTQTLRLRDAIDATKIVDFKADLITSLTTRTLKAPNRSGTIATEEFVAERMPTGTILHGYWGTTPPAGFVFADGRSVGNASSGATNRANADTRALFTKFWTFNDATRFPLQNSDGSVATRGANATVDYDANKRIVLPNHSGRVAAGRDDLSGTNQGILNGSAVGYPDAGIAASTTRGAVGGQSVEAATVGVSGSISGSTSGGLSVAVGGTTGGESSGQGGVAFGGSGYFADSHTHSWGGTFGTSGSLTVGGSFSGSGSTNVVTNVTPTIVCDVVIAL